MRNYIINLILGFSLRSFKRLITYLVDIASAVMATILAFALRFDVWPSLGSELLKISIMSIGIFLPIFETLGLYRAILRYSGLSMLVTVAKALIIYLIIFVSAILLLSMHGNLASIPILQALIFSILVVLSRLCARYLLGGMDPISQSKLNKRVLIYGAGSAGRQLCSGIGESNEMKVVGYVDDDRRLHGQHINQIKIFDPQFLPEIINKEKITHILLAIPSASRLRRNQLLDQLKNYQIHVLTVPGLMDISNGKIGFSELREIDIEDLLGREPVEADPLLMCKNIAKKVVLVTGAGGSIGSELCRQILDAQPGKLLLVDNSEFALHTIFSELQRIVQTKEICHIEIVPLIANVQDEERVKQVFETFMPDTVYHVAAYKHVPLVESNPIEGLRNNIWGTLNVAKKAYQYNAKNFTLISTDKAVRPTSIMGASKRIAELAIQAMSEKIISENNKICYSIVRFGNVLGSSGSVIPLYRQQIAAGGPITLTDEEITRYFMTIPEAAQLVIQASGLAAGGDIFILDMGERLKISDLARKIIQLSGLTVADHDNPDGDIEIKVIGLRAGEKLHEELLIDGNSSVTEHPRIFRAHEYYFPYEEFFEKLSNLQAAIAKNNIPLIRKVIGELVTGYSDEYEVVDLISVHKSYRDNLI